MDAALIPIEEWCDDNENCELPVGQILITADGEILQYCDECGEAALQRERDNS